MSAFAIVAGLVAAGGWGEGEFAVGFSFELEQAVNARPNNKMPKIFIDLPFIEIACTEKF